MLSLEFKHRVDRWIETMPKLFFKRLGLVEVEGFTTMKHLSPEEAAKGPFKPMPVGTAWGAKWQYGWFRSKVKLPKEAAGERVMLKVLSGGESAVFVNGVDLGGNSVWGSGGVENGERLLTLSRKAKGGEIFNILVEGYAGHGPRVCGGGPVPHGVVQVPEPSACQTVVGETEFGIWNEEVFQLWLDAKILNQLYEETEDKSSLRVDEIGQALLDMTLAVDLELPWKELSASAKAGRKALKPALDAKNGSTQAVMHCFGHSHIDIAWLWPLEETERKCARTFGSQLALMEEYPEFKFLQSQPYAYQVTKELYPEVYKRIKDAIKRGQWIPEGGMWVEPDTNITGGESLIRQFIHGKRFFKEEFGVDSKLMWLPDVFGYSGALPQIMRSCGIDSFSTQKIFWTYNGGDKFPYNIFWWEGVDGTKVLSYIHNDYNSHTDARCVLDRWKERSQHEAFHKGRLLPFGYGDGGGGPTREHLEQLRRLKDLQGVPKCEIENPVDYFETLDTSKIPTWIGELYFQCHRGTYTTQARTKKANRKSEFALREAELWSCAAAALAKFKIPLAKTDALWKTVLLNQFHDIIPGSSIQRVYERNLEDLADVMKGAKEIADSAKQALAKSGSAVTVFNSLSWERDELVALPEGVESVEGAPVQSFEGESYALVEKLPSCGWRSFKKGAASKLAAAKAVKASVSGLENELVKAKFNAAGELTSFVDKKSGREFMQTPGNKFGLFKDVPFWFDAWDIDSTYKLQEIELAGKAKVELVANGPLFATLRISRKIGESELTQDVTLRASSRRIDFKTRVDWRESHKLLKVFFPVDVRSEDALQEIQFGHVRRPTHASKLYDAARFEVCNQKWTALTEENRGAAVLNDCKYGVGVEGSRIGLTLLRSPLAPDMNADKGLQEFTYSFTAWEGAFKDSGIVREGYELNVPASAFKGDAGEKSLLSVDNPAIVAETVKPAEDGSGDIVVRLYESLRTSSDVALTLGFKAKKAQLVNMLEEKTSELALDGESVKLSFKPFEIKTLRFKL